MLKQALFAIVTVASVGAVAASADEKRYQTINIGGSRSITVAVSNPDANQPPYALTGDRSDSVAGQALRILPVRLTTQSVTVAPGWSR